MKTGFECIQAGRAPCNVDELRAEESHALDTIDEVVQTLSEGWEEVRDGVVGRRTWAVLGGKYSNDHQVRFSFFACSIFCVIFMGAGEWGEETETEESAIYALAELTRVQRNDRDRPE